MTIDGKTTTKEVTVHDLTIGTIEADHFTMVEAAPDIDDTVDGSIGLNILAQFDIDLDLKAKSLNLYSQDHCPGKVVYWADKYGAVPFETDAVGHPYFRAQLDGHDLTVSPQLNFASTMNMIDAAKRLEIRPDDPKLVNVPAPIKEKGPYYSYPFSELAIGDLVIRRPRVLLFPVEESKHCNPNGVEKRCYGTAELLLGRAELQQLHLYFAFKEKTLYLTCVDPSAGLVCNANVGPSSAASAAED